MRILKSLSAWCDGDTNSYGDISEWDTSQVTDMSKYFQVVKHLMKILVKEYKKVTAVKVCFMELLLPIYYRCFKVTDMVPCFIMPNFKILVFGIHVRIC